MLVHLMTECLVLEDARSHHFDEDDPITFLFNEPEVALSYLSEGCWPHWGWSHMMLDPAPEENNNNINRETETIIRTAITVT